MLLGVLKLVWNIWRQFTTCFLLLLLFTVQYIDTAFNIWPPHHEGLEFLINGHIRHEMCPSLEMFLTAEKEIKYADDLKFKIVFTILSSGLASKCCIGLATYYYYPYMCIGWVEGVAPWIICPRPCCPIILGIFALKML